MHNIEYNCVEVERNQQVSITMRTCSVLWRPLVEVGRITLADNITSTIFVGLNTTQKISIRMLL